MQPSESLPFQKQETIERGAAGLGRILVSLGSKPLSRDGNSWGARRHPSFSLAFPGEANVRQG